ncbi:ATP-binding protein [Streptomyces sp. NPDC047000]|uniref:ATP-binding protein n=1 Tax=Streptomyces sp. NPDC047000 TaxID=3155474 RepID=UPI0033F1822C
MHFTSSPGGARLARRLVSHRLDAWGHPYDSAANETVTLITAELCANAVTHGRVPGRDFHLRLPLGPTVIRVEVSDAHSERQPLLTPGRLPKACPAPPSIRAGSDRESRVVPQGGCDRGHTQCPELVQVARRLLVWPLAGSVF